MRRVAVLALSLSLIACDDSSDPSPPPPSSNPDATVAADSGADPADAGFVDSGVQPVACDPVDGSGCAGNSCIWIGNPIGTQCRDEAATPKTHEQVCDARLFDCQVGYSCERLSGENDSHCRKLCRTNNNRDCDAVVGSNPDGYRCSVTLDRPTSLGVCAPDMPECLPFADMCPAMEYCEYTGGQLRCTNEGTPRVGEACPINRCVRGAICLARNGNPPSCHTPCDPAAAPDPCAQGTCNQVSAAGRMLPFGVCE